MYLLLVKSLEGCFAVKVFINHEKTKIMIQFVVSSYVLNFIFRKAFFLSPEICKLDIKVYIKFSLVHYSSLLAVLNRYLYYFVGAKWKYFFCPIVLGFNKLLGWDSRIAVYTITGKQWFAIGLETPGMS